MPKHEYDASAALEILGAYAEQEDPDPEASADQKGAAAKELLEQLAALTGRMADFEAGDDYEMKGAVAAGFTFADASVTYNSGEFTVVSRDGDRRIPVPIRFNRARGIFEGEALDTSRVPVPGEPKEKRRDALVVIADTLVHAMNKQEG